MDTSFKSLLSSSLCVSALNAPVEEDVFPFGVLFLFVEEPESELLPPEEAPEPELEPELLPPEEAPEPEPEPELLPPEEAPEPEPEPELLLPEEVPEPELLPPEEAPEPDPDLDLLPVPKAFFVSFFVVFIFFAKLLSPEATPAMFPSSMDSLIFSAELVILFASL